MVHNHLINGEFLIDFNHSQAMFNLMHNNQHHKHVKNYQEVPYRVMQLNNISCNEKCAVSKICKSKYFSSPGCLLSIEKKSQSSPTLQYT